MHHWDLLVWSVSATSGGLRAISLVQLPFVRATLVWSQISYPPTVCFCSSGVLLQRLRAIDVAAAADDHPGLHWNTVLLRGGADAELLCRFAGILERRRCWHRHRLFCRTEKQSCIFYFMRGYFKISLYTLMHWRSHTFGQYLPFMPAALKKKNSNSIAWLLFFILHIFSFNFSTLHCVIARHLHYFFLLHLVCRVVKITTRSVSPT